MATCFGVKLLGSRGRPLVGAVAILSNEEVGPPEEGFPGVIEVVVLIFVLFIIIVDVLQDPSILEKR